MTVVNTNTSNTILSGGSDNGSPLILRTNTTRSKGCNPAVGDITARLGGAAGSELLWNVADLA